MSDNEYQFLTRVNGKDKVAIESEDGKETLLELTPEQLQKITYIKVETKDGNSLELDFLHRPNATNKTDEKGSTKYQFLNKQLEKNKLYNNDIDDAFSLLNEFYENLPKKAKTKDREQTYYCVADNFRDLLKSQIKALADNPFVKIEIINKEEIEQDKKVLEWCKKSICCMEGYLDGLGREVRELQKLRC